VYALHEYESLPHTCVACFALVCEEILGVCFPIPQSGLVSVPVWLVVDYGACEHVSHAHPTRIQEDLGQDLMPAIPSPEFHVLVKIFW
jgi:hypothetical protein